jgi:hypothetical protein
MYETHKQEEFSRAYICALAAPLGFNEGNYRVDDDSVDVEYKAKYDITSKIRNPHINFQLKCTKITFKDDGFLHFPLKIKNYNDLRGTNQAFPIYLVVLCVPENEEDWVEVKQEELLLRYSAYWVSLKDAPQVKNKKSVTLKISKKQKFDKDIFKLLMDKTSEGMPI